MNLFFMVMVVVEDVPWVAATVQEEVVLLSWEEDVGSLEKLMRIKIIMTRTYKIMVEEDVHMRDKEAKDRA